MSMFSDDLPQYIFAAQILAVIGVVGVLTTKVRRFSGLIPFMLVAVFAGVAFAQGAPGITVVIPHGSISIGHFATMAVPFLALAVQLGLDPRVRPFWFSLKAPWPTLIGAGLSLAGTVLAAKAAGDTWQDACMKGMIGLATTGGIGHTVGSLTTPPDAKPEPAAKS